MPAPDLRLPTFVTAASIRDILSWANSIKREFRDAARKVAIDGWCLSDPAGDIYEDIVRLLARPRGGFEFDRLVRVADREKQRGLTKALVKRAVTALGPGWKNDSCGSDLVLELIRSKQDYLAGWTAFEQLSWTAGPGSKDSPLVTVIEQNEALQTALGQYWTDWLALQNAAQVIPGEEGEWPAGDTPTSDAEDTRRSPECDASNPPDQKAPKPEGSLVASPLEAEGDHGSEEEDDRHTWSRTIAALIERLQQTSEFDSGVASELDATRDQLTVLITRHDARAAQRDAHLRRAAAEYVEQLRVELEALNEEGPWHHELIRLAGRLPADSPTMGVLARLVEWAGAARSRLDAASARRKAALDRVQTDDSEEATAEFGAANRARRQARETTAREAADWISKVSGGENSQESLQEPRANLGSANIPIDEAPTEHFRPDPAEECTPVSATTDHVEQPSDAEESTHHVSSAANSNDMLSPEAPPKESAVPSNDEAADEENVPAPVDSDTQPQGYERLVEVALRNGRYGLAAHLQRAIETLGSSESPVAPSAVLEALCIGNAITPDRLATAAHRYGGVLPGVLADLNSQTPLTESVRLLTFAGAIKPALFAFQTSAAEAIRAAAIGGLGSNLHELVQFVLEELPKRGGIIDLATLRSGRHEQQVRDEVERVRAELIEMADGAPSKKALFARASIIWRDLFQGDGSIPRAVAAVRQHASNSAPLAREAAEEVERHLDGRARVLDRAAKRNRDAWLEGKALDWLLTCLRELRDLLQAYVTAAAQASGHRSTHTTETQRRLRDLVAVAREDIVRCSLRADCAAAADVAGRVLDDVVALLDGDPGDGGLTVDALLDGDLLLIRPYPAEARARALSKEGALQLLAGARPVLEGHVDYRSAFSALLEAGRFQEAAEAAALVQCDADEKAKLSQDIEDARLERLNSVERRALALRVRLDDLLGADTEGKIDPANSLQLERLIGSLRKPGLEPTDVALRLDFVQLEDELAQLETAVKDGADLMLMPLRREIETLAVSPKTASILNGLADRRELSALRECLNGVKAGADLDLTGHQERLLRTFANRFLTSGFLHSDPKQRNVVDLISAVRERRDGLVDFSHLAEEDVPLAEALLTAWLKVKRAGRTSADTVRDLLGELRFTNVRISGERNFHGARRYSVQCDTTSDRRDCPAPAFGSAANGRLEVLVLDAPHVTDGVELHGLVKSLEHNSTVPTLVIVTGVLPADRRLSFMVEARRVAGQIPCGLLDEAGVLFLASWAGRRRADLFSVALPAGGVQPYSDAPGKTSPEMFFGRSNELGELWRADGSCLVYGGRQLGKTALLEQVRLRHHKPPSQVVVYGSLQGETDLWRKVAQLFADGGIAVKGRSAAAIETGVREWLKDEARRIVILVDEADTYLEAEMQQSYPSLARVRDMMQATERRCKFVFAGLHNVQRLARSPNSPLLHFGTPLRIGPLFGQDLGEARDMVVTPMAAAGIVFENATLPNRILSAVGFYPSLLQTFGTTLIERVNRTATSRLKGSSLLPIVVSEHDVRNALEDSAFKENIREKFRNTLSLDERYRLITLAMLQRSLDRSEQTGIAPSLTDVEVQSLAREWWPQGFEEDGSLDAFQGLLQEMVGLGVLIETGGKYAIRSSSIAAMLGGKEQIEQELVELSQSPGPQKLDTGSLRRLEKTTRAPAPLTSRQEAQLLGPDSAAAGVHVVLGSRALGLEQVASSLRELSDDELAIRAGVFKSARDFPTQLANGHEALRRSRRNLLVLCGPWLGREMVDAALEACARRTPRSGPLRVLIAPNWVDWDAADEVVQGRLWGAELLTLSTLGRSGLGQWLRALGVPESPKSVDRLRSLTGGYPLYLSGFGRATDLVASAQEAFERIVADPDTLVGLGLQDQRLSAAARIVFQYDPADIAADLDSMGVGPGELVVAHLERLGVLEPIQDQGATRWRLNPFVAAVLSRHP